MDLKPQSYLGSPGRPSWSPDGTKLAVMLNQKALVVEPESDTVLRELDPKEEYLGAPQFSPVSEDLLYAAYTRVEKQNKKRWAIKLAPADGAKAETVIPHGRTPKWSPDGSQIAFSSYTDDFQTKVSVATADGSESRELSEKPHGKDFSWSPDGKGIAYEALTDHGKQLRLAPLREGTPEQHLTQGGEGQYNDRTPTWSPNGKTILFERRHKEFPAASLWSVEPETGFEKELFQKHADLVDPVFSPDGKKVVFASNHGGRGDLDLFEMDLGDLSIRPISEEPGDEHSPAFSPDGQTIAFFNTNRKREKQERHQLNFYDLESNESRTFEGRGIITES